MEWLSAALAAAGDRFPWGLLVLENAAIARAWLAGRFVQRSVYDEVRIDRDRWRDLALAQNPLLGAAVSAAVTKCGEDPVGGES